jgi:purine-cytosine permease-like protein
MEKIKRLMGIVWMAMGPLAIIFLIRTAISEIEKKPVVDTIIQWGVFVVVFIPIAIGLMIFGYFAFKGDYHHPLPVDSSSLED